jgi:hypothetical protein
MMQIAHGVIMLCFSILIRLSHLYFIVSLGLGVFICESLFYYFIRFTVLGVFM